jgi:hypothetical protein
LNDDITLAVLRTLFTVMGYANAGDEAASTLIWAKTEGLVAVDRAVRDWRDKSVRNTEADEGTYEENHITYPSGLPRP